MYQCLSFYDKTPSLRLASYCWAFHWKQKLLNIPFRVELFPVILPACKKESWPMGQQEACCWCQQKGHWGSRWKDSAICKNPLQQSSPRCFSQISTHSLPHLLRTGVTPGTSVNQQNGKWKVIQSWKAAEKWKNKQI